MKQILVAWLIGSLCSSPLYAKVPSGPTRDQLNGAAQARLELFVKIFSKKIRSGRDLGPLFFTNISPSERSRLQAKLRALGRPPKLVRDGSSLVFTQGKEQVKVTWPDLNRNQIKVGSVQWTYDPSAPLLPQLNNLEMRLNAAASGKSAVFSLLVPQAEAAIPLLAWVAATIGGALIGSFAGDIKNFIGDSTCYLIAGTGNKPWLTSTVCQDWKSRMDAFAKQQALDQAGAPTAVNSNMRWVEYKESTCSESEDRKSAEYSTWMLELNKDEKGDWGQKPGAEWFKVVATRTDGKMTQVLTFDEKTSDRTPENSQVQFIYGTQAGKTVIDRIRLRSKADDPNGMSETGFVTILMTDKEADIPVLYREEAMKMKALVASIEQGFDGCLNQRFAERFERESIEEAPATQ